MEDLIRVRLERFARENRMLGKGGLAVALVVTRRAKELGLPLNPANLLTEGGGQVRGLSKASVQRILRDYGIERVLAEEGGRTSRGSIRKMEAYVLFLNGLAEEGLADLDLVEAWWVERVREYFASQPFHLRYDPSKSLRRIIGDLLDQAKRRQASAPGSTFAGTMLQHLVGAKLDLLLGEGRVEHHSASTADSVTGRSGDFVIEDVAIHVTTAPGEALIRKCKNNLEQGLRPLIITINEEIACGLADNEGVADRIDVFNAEQFLAGNLYELGRFAKEGRATTARDLVTRYNAIVSEHETDPSLRIEETR